MPKRLRFGRFELHPAERLLLQDGHPVTLGARAFDVLLALIERRDRLVGKAELLDLVWRGLVVEEANLPVQVSGLRKLIGSQAIATVPGLGYRFVMPLEDEQTAATPWAHSRTLELALRTNVPAAIDALLGREADIETLTGWLGENRLVTVLGPGGIGKTRLAQAVARVALDSQPDGVWWVNLAALSTLEQIVPSVAKAARIQIQEGNARADLLRALATRRMLLVLDGCEHLAAAVAQFVGSMLAATAAVRVLATSQEPLGTHGEHLYRVRPLAVPPSGASLAVARSFPAVQLLEGRAHAADARFALTAESVERAIDLCRQLDGVALAIEMAAARLPVLGVEGLYRRLGDRLRILCTSDREGPIHHRTLRATLDWSHALLDDHERAVLRRLSVFVGSFTIEDAQHAAALFGLDAVDVLDAIEGLVQRSLVGLEPTEPPRYRLANTTRLYALDRLSDAGEWDTAWDRRAAHVQSLLEIAFGDWLSAPEERWRGRLQADFEDIRAALEWTLARGDGDRRLAMLSSALPVWLYRDARSRAEGLQHLRLASQSLTPCTPGPVAARLWFSLALLLPYEAIDEQLEALGRAETLARGIGSVDQRCHALIESARLLLRAGRASDADLALLEVGRSIRQTAPARIRGLFFLTLGSSRQSAGRLAEASVLFESAADLLARCGADMLALCAMNDHADSLWALGNLSGAMAAFAKTVAMARSLPQSSPDTIGVPLGNWAAISFEQGSLESGTRQLLEAVALLRELDKAWELCDALALRLTLLDRHLDAARVLGFVDARYRAISETRQPNEQRLRDKVVSRLRSHLTMGQLKQLGDLGALLSDEDVLHIGFNDPATAAQLENTR